MGLEFYQTLNIFASFRSVAKKDLFTPVPDDWVVILTDIQGSTKAIEAGQYKEVNLIGVSAIASVQNQVKTREFPFSFGGDGATILLPLSLLEQVKPALAQLKTHALNNFNLNLRIGIVPISKLTSLGHQVLVSRFRVSEHLTMAMFSGGGIRAAEDLVKDPNPAHQKEFLLAASAIETSPDLDSLSCRWAPIPSRKGTMLSLLIRTTPKGEDQQILAQILEHMSPYFENDEHRPISAQTLSGEPIGQTLRREYKLRKDLSWLGLLFEVLIPVLLAHLFKKSKFMQNYVEQFPVHSDYRKAEDAIKMVMDCSKTQALEVRDYLEDLFKQGLIFYGLHESSSALMTCVVKGLEAGSHIHFIDGADGGYTLAAKRMKAQSQKS